MGGGARRRLIGKYIAAKTSVFIDIAFREGARLRYNGPRRCTPTAGKKLQILLRAKLAARRPELASMI